MEYRNQLNEVCQLRCQDWKGVMITMHHNAINRESSLTNHDEP